MRHRCYERYSGVKGTTTNKAVAVVSVDFGVSSWTGHLDVVPPWPFPTLVAAGAELCQAQPSLRLASFQTRLSILIQMVLSEQINHPIKRLFK